MQKLNIDILYGDFSCGYRSRTFDFSNLLNDSKGLTGSELSCFMFSKYLCRLGHSVTLYTHLRDPKLSSSFWEGVKIKDFPLHREARAIPHAIISWNEPDYFCYAPDKTLKVIHQQLNDFDFCQVPQFDRYVDLYLSPSPAHLQYISQFTPSKHKWQVLSNCVDPEILTDNNIKKEDGLCLYMSSPDRGLHHLLSQFEVLKKRVPNFKLIVAYDFHSWYNKMKNVSNDAHDIALDIKESANRARYIKYVLEKYKDDPALIHLDAVSKVQVNELLSKAVVLPYSCDTIRWSEGYSVTIMESAYKNCLPITTNIDALGQIYGSAVPMVPAPVSQHMDEYIDLVVRGLTDQQWREEQLVKTKALAQNYLFADHALKFEQILYSEMEKQQKGIYAKQD